MPIKEIATAKAAAPGAKAITGFAMPGMEVEGEAIREALVAKGGAGTKALAVGKAGAVKGATTGKAAATAKGAGVVKAGSGGAFFSGKGLGLGASLGLGGWGPVIIGAVGAVVLYAFLKSRQTGSDAGIDQSETDLEIKEALDSGPEGSLA